MCTSSYFLLILFVFFIFEIKGDKGFVSKRYLSPYSPAKAPPPAKTPPTSVSGDVDLLGDIMDAEVIDSSVFYLMNEFKNFEKFYFFIPLSFAFTAYKSCLFCKQCC